MLLDLGRGMRPRAAGRNWLPGQLSGLIGWYDMADSATITNTGIYLDALADKSGAGNDLAGLTDNRPRIDTVTQNGLAMFDCLHGSVGKFMSLDGTSSGAPPTGLSSMASSISVVFKQSSTNSAGALIALKDTNFADALVPDLQLSGRAYLPDDTGSGYIQLDPTPMPRGSAYCLTFVWSGSGIACYVNGELEGSDSAAGSNYINRFVLGYRVYTASLWRGAIGEVCVLNRALTDDERTAMESYLMTKWEIV